ncbi:MAG TPA: hypothetical protein VFC53_11520 [Dehalococcoidia bacterium]|nr:hypothetical protein [Dehalococcoidia bacterium]
MAELSLRGLLALPTIRNVAGVDIVVSSPDGSFFANLQVKTSQHKVNFWPISTGYQSWRGTHCYYVFLRRRNDGPGPTFDVFLERAARVAAEVDRWEARWKEIGNKPFAPCWFAVEPKTVGPLIEHREKRLKRLAAQWSAFGRSESEPIEIQAMSASGFPS